jgi:hypothetical protein
MHPERNLMLDIVTSIRKGEVDEYLTDITDACSDRRKSVRDIAAINMRSVLAPGSRVVLDGLRPKYINGSTAVVKEINRTRAVIELDQPTDRFRGNVTVPLSCLTPCD